MDELAREPREKRCGGREGRQGETKRAAGTDAPAAL